MANDQTRDIRVLREPTVYLVGRQVVDAATVDRFLADHGVSWQTDTEVAGEHLAEVAGRLCYMSFARPRPGGNKAYLDHILEVGHGSVLEHAVWNFVFTGVSRSLTHELVRHRHMGYSQLSQRYVDESVAEYVEPDAIACDPELHALWLEAVAQAPHLRYGIPVDFGRDRREASFYIGGFSLVWRFDTDSGEEHQVLANSL